MINSMQKDALLQSRTNELLVSETRLKKAREHIGALLQVHPDYGTNTGHGHLWERPDGVRARCGGRSHCTPCRETHAEILKITEDARLFLEGSSC